MSHLWRKYMIFLSLKLCRMRCDGENFEWLIFQREGSGKTYYYQNFEEMSC